MHGLFVAPPRGQVVSCRSLWQPDEYLAVDSLLTKPFLTRRRYGLVSRVVHGQRLPDEKQAAHELQALDEEQAALWLQAPDEQQAAL